MIPARMNISRALRAYRRGMTLEVLADMAKTVDRVVALSCPSAVMFERLAQLRKMKTWAQRSGGIVLTDTTVLIPGNVVVPRKYKVINSDVPDIGNIRIKGNAS
jgi:TusA-related sulfurtransferase